MEHVRADLRAAGLLLREGLLAEGLFHCQQAGEKALKTLLVEALQLATRVFEEVMRRLPPGLDEPPDLLQS